LGAEGGPASAGGSQGPAVIAGASFVGGVQANAAVDDILQFGGAAGVTA
jgi:hypothetical protein